MYNICVNIYDLSQYITYHITHLKQLCLNRHYKYVITCNVPGPEIRTELIKKSFFVSFVKGN